MDEHEGSDFEDASTPKLHERIAKSSQDQERQLDAIHNGVVRLKNQAQATNDEVVAQNDLLDHISVEVSDTDAAVQQQTQVARKVTSAHRKVCVYYVIIGFLAVALIVVLAV